MVIPRSRSALSLSRTHAYLKEPLPSSAASCCTLSAFVVDEILDISDKRNFFRDRPAVPHHDSNFEENAGWCAYLLEFLNSTLVDTTAFVDQMS